ncbi:MAG: putative thymidylate synthase [Candidatus Micrarchaeota archaeon]|nr:MAG: putative thymidylate synthase [Candidatus Micrarchaeota archaeon]
MNILFFKDQLITGNPESPVAVCTLWLNKDYVIDRINRNNYCILGNLYTTDGISYVIRNILANPNIRTIVMLGPDLMNSGKAFKAFMQYGIDDNYKIVNGEGYIHKVISKEALNLFRNNVRIVEFNDHLDKLDSFLEEVNKSSERGSFSDPIVIDQPDIPAKDMNIEDLAYKADGRDFIETWLKALDIVDKFGELKKTEYNIDQKEVFLLTSVIRDTTNVNIPEWLPISKSDLIQYNKEFFDINKPEGVDYTYGERLFNYAFNDKIYDQIDYIKAKLKESSYTRRAVAVTWNLEKDQSSSNPPCLIAVQYLIKFNKLYLYALFRSHDIYGAWILNAYALIMLQHRVAEQLNIKPGAIAINSVSAHIYKNNFQRVKDILDKYYRNKQEPFVIDERGYFIISVNLDKKFIEVKHKLNDGRDSGYIFHGRSASEIYRKIINENLVSRMDHAAYLGRELARAEYALNNSSEYIQDSSM